MVTTIGAFVGILVVLIIAHEFGHFIAAKASRVRVDEFGLGFPPRVLSVKRGETVYSLNAIPLGGFTKMAGEEDPKVPRSLAGKRIGTRLLVLSAGSLMNIILPLLLFSIAFMIPHNLVVGKVVIEEVALNSPAQRYIQLNLGKEVTILVQHSDSTTESVEVVPRWRPPEGQGAIGITVGMTDATIVRQSEPAWRAAPLAVSTCLETFVLFKNGLLGMATGTTPFQVAGPVGIAQITGEVARAGISPLLEFAAFLSINLALINIFPLPALDGGRIVFVLVEWARRGKRVSPKTEGLVHFIGFAALISVIMVITYHDIIRIIGGGSLIP